MFIFAANIHLMKQFFLLLFSLFGFAGATPEGNHNLVLSAELELMNRLLSVQTMQGQILPDQSILEMAIRGYTKLLRNESVPQPEILTLVDFSLPSDKERMWVFDIETGKLLYNSLVAHGRNSGDKLASHFSNLPGSYTSSLGFYLTGDIYQGKHGLSLYLDGLEKGINDKARERAIVIHGAEYVTANFIQQNGRLGRSLGCPALPPHLTRDVINTIKGGTCLFIYAPDKNYLANSPVLN